jgi:hypothetical protein
MTRGKVKNMLAMLPILQAYAEGATVQINVGSQEYPEWEDCHNPEFNDDPKRYRAKPRPIVRWGILQKSGKISMLYDTAEAADAALADLSIMNGYHGARVIKLVEEMK